MCVLKVNNNILLYDVNHWNTVIYSSLLMFTLESTDKVMSFGAKQKQRLWVVKIHFFFPQCFDTVIEWQARKTLYTYPQQFSSGTNGPLLRISENGYLERGFGDAGDSGRHKSRQCWNVSFCLAT